MNLGDLDVVRVREITVGVFWGGTGALLVAWFVRWVIRSYIAMIRDTTFWADEKFAAWWHRRRHGQALAKETETGQEV